MNVRKYYITFEPGLSVVEVMPKIIFATGLSVLFPQFYISEILLFLRSIHYNRNRYTNFTSKTVNPFGVHGV